jgi:mRNA-degrading endonuclease RelE of RelBE toxin-antitoxin system
VIWDVDFAPSAKRKKEKLPPKIKEALAFLVQELETAGPIRKNWPNFGDLEKSRKRVPANAYHCHLKKGRPTYVACWSVEDKKLKIIEIFYVGTHENAPY